MSKQRVVVLGASPNPGRFSNRAVRSLLEHGHEVIPVNPGYDEVEGLPVRKSLAEVEGPVDTLTVYVSPRHIAPYIPEVLDMRPKRVVLNPGTTAEVLVEALKNAKIETIKDCTLVMLNGGSF